MVSLKDVAALSGVSPATVSRAINNPGMVDPETRKTIQAAMKKLNYRPNLVASGLRTRNSRQIALIVPDAIHHTSATMIQHTSRLLQEKGYTLILGNHHNRYETEKELLNTYFSRNIDGIILYLIYDETRAVQSLLEQEERRVPVVIVGRRINVDSFSNVATDKMMQLQKAYFEAGSDIVLAPTFTANRIKLDEYGLVDKIEEMNHQLVAISKAAAGDRGLVAGDMTMTGRQLAPMGDMGFEELIDIYKEQAGYLVDAGVDLFVVETMMSLNECRAALIAIREVTDLPVCVTLSFNEDGRTLFGTDACTAMVVLQSLGADAVGVNCSTGPEQMAELVRR